MNAHQLALQTARLELLKIFNPADTLELWKLNYLYSLHFQGYTPPQLEDISVLIQSEPIAFWFASAVRVLDLWQEQTHIRQDAARSIAVMLDIPFTEDDIVRVHQNTIDFCFKRSEAEPVFEHWMFNHMLYAITSDDIRRGYAEVDQPAKNAEISFRFLIFFETTQT